MRISVTLVGPEEYSRSVHPVTKRIGFGGSGFGGSGSGGSGDDGGFAIVAGGGLVTGLLMTADPGITGA